MMKSPFFFVILVCVLSAPIYCSETTQYQTSTSGPKSPSQSKRLPVSHLSSSSSTAKTSLFLPHEGEPKSLVPRAPNTLSPHPYLGQLLDQPQFQQLIHSENLTLKKVLKYILQLFKEEVSAVTERLNEMNPEEYVVESDLKRLVKGLGVFSNSLYTQLTKLAPGIAQYKDLTTGWKTWKTKAFKDLSSQLEKLALENPERALQKQKLKWDRTLPLVSQNTWDAFSSPRTYGLLWTWLSEGDGSALARVCSILAKIFSSDVSKDDRYGIKMELGFKKLIPYFIRRYFIDNKDEKTFEGILNGLIKTAIDFIERRLRLRSVEGTIVLIKDTERLVLRPVYYEEVEISAWVKKTLLYMFQGRESVTASEYNAMLEGIPAELQRQARGYFNAVRNGHIYDSHYDYEKSYEIETKGVLSTVKGRINTLPLEQDMGTTQLSNALLSFIYIGVHIDPALRFAIFDLLESAKLDIILKSYTLVEYRSPSKSLTDLVVQPQGLFKFLELQIPVELRGIYGELFDCYLNILRRVQAENRGGTRELSYKEVYLALSDSEKKMRAIIQKILKIIETL